MTNYPLPPSARPRLMLWGIPKGLPSRGKLLQEPHARTQLWLCWGICWGQYDRLRAWILSPQNGQQPTGLAHYAWVLVVSIQLPEERLAKPAADLHTRDREQRKGEADMTKPIFGQRVGRFQPRG
eukprot:1158325-Pelagomonas_calceolata.AAC.12